MTATAPGGLTVTRIVNSCVLLEVAGHAVLTDPWFTERWHLHRGEPLGMGTDQLPPLTAILASHSFVNHWDRRGLATLPGRDRIRVFVPTSRMARRALRLGFGDVRLLEWGRRAPVADGIEVEAVEAQSALGQRSNNYVLSTPAGRVLFGGEAEAVAPLLRYGAGNPPVDLALLPVNGLTVPGKGPIVMGPAQAVEAARAVGASVLVPIHDAHAADPLWRFIRRTGTAADAVELASGPRSASAGGAAGDPGAAVKVASKEQTDLTVVDLPTGRPWTFSAPVRHSGAGAG